MKKTLLYFLAFLLVLSINAQKPGRISANNQTFGRNCGMVEHENYLKSIDPLYELKKQTGLKEMENAIKNMSLSNKTGPVYTLPTVVHVVYNTAAQNLTDAQIQNMINLLNKDFRRTNSDASNTPSAFLPFAADMEIEFCLATKDPNGLPTTGIIHKSTTVTSFSTNNAVKSNASGGSTAWPTNQYFNIWICNLGGGILGYGEFPTSPLSNTYGAVSTYCTVPGPAACPPYNLNRTMTHELSHCFNLYHIWGDDGTACSGSDQVNDTPNQAGPTSGCPNFPKTDACTPSGNGVMYMNYMDYSNDNCMNMFSLGQKARARAAIQTYLATVIANTGACATSSNDAGISLVSQPTGTICSTTISPSVTIKNFGSAALTSATINYKIDNNAPSTYSWTGNLATSATAVVTLPSLTATTGAHTFTAYTTMPNGVADPSNANDTSKSSFTVIAGGQALPFSEGFEGTTFVPTGWTLNNPDGLTTWARTTVAAKTGTASAFMDYFNYNATGERDEMVLPALDLSSQVGPQMTFQVAYRLYTDPTANPNFSDTLEVLISTNCGATYTSLYKKFGATLTTATPTFSTTQFTPTANQWRMETINLSSYATTTNAIIKIRGISDFENQMYVDDINISGGVVTSVSNLSSNTIRVYPNPANGVIFVIPDNPSKSYQIKLINMLGKTVLEGVHNNQSLIMLDVENQPNGVYFVSIKQDEKTIVEKIVISR